MAEVSRRHPGRLRDEPVLFAAPPHHPTLLSQPAYPSRQLRAPLLRHTQHPLNKAAQRRPCILP